MTDTIEAPAPEAKPEYDAAAITALAKIPTTGDIDKWDDAQKALADMLGFTTVINEVTVIAPRGVREAYLMALDRTKLDPISRQIYLAFIGGKWLIIVGIDGFRLIAQRTGEYRGQDEPQWTSGDATDEKWYDVWVQQENPGACRVGVYRKGFKKATVGIATWKAYGKSNGQWKNNGPHMLSIRAEAQALRKAFPQELSGLYTPEEFAEAEAEGESLGRDWLADVEVLTTVPAVNALFKELQESGEWNPKVDAAFRARKAKLAMEAEEAASVMTVKEKTNAK